MKRFIHTLDRFGSPVLILSYAALCILLLAATPQGKGPFLWAILCGVATAAAFRWGTWAILVRARKKATPSELAVLTGTVEILFLLFTAAATVLTILLWEIPALWVFFPTPLFGLRGAIRFHTTL